MRNRYRSHPAEPTTFGRIGTIWNPASPDLPEVAKAVAVTSIADGTLLKVLPVGNAEGDWITFDPVTVGYMPPFQVKEISTDTTCDVVIVTG
ncbi:hypothetical protein ACVDG3_18280 [Meridianimarinicoccus sp. RP-17]|uniref:hypothetical protein n=1 Tax=Meridianimarinicoccus zhengii TaxID=2056810 RepID=UPI000DAC1AE2|nr:hypothetical protein [Phycocomes zhengii]